MKVIITSVRGWQKRCWEWAKEGEKFEIDGVSLRHLHFIKELCAAYYYEYKLFGKKLVVTLPHKRHISSTLLEAPS